MFSARSVSLPSITPETRSDYESPSPGPDYPRPLPKRDKAEFCQCYLFDSLTMSLAILTNMMSASVHYRKHM